MLHSVLSRWLNHASFPHLRRPRPLRRRQFHMERLENRVVLTTTLFLDFGGGVGMGNTISITADNFRQIFGAADTGTDMTDTVAGADNMDFTPLNYDFDLDGNTDNNDITALANAVVPLVQRALEPFDINIVVAAATNFANAVASVASNAGDASGEFDAYVYVMTITSTALGGGSVGAAAPPTGLFGRAARRDLDAQAGNDSDEAALTFADEVFAFTNGTPGTAAFNQNLAQRIAYTATHEAFHTFTHKHTNGLMASGDVIRVASNTRENPFIVTRFDLAHDEGVAEPNNYLLLANDADIGLRDSDGDGVPDLAYSTGTGAHDEVILTNLGGGIVDVDVNAYSNSARTALIASESYNIDLAADTEGTILVDASINNDEVRVDATIPATLRLRGGQGIDGVATENDLLTLQSGGLSGTYTPGGAGAGAVVYAGGAAVNFSEFENVEADNVPIHVQPLILSSTVLDENDSLTVTVDFVNIDTFDTHDVVINWGDGSPDTVFTLSAGQRSFSRAHTYLDDNPTATPSDNYTITVTVTDQDGDAGSAQAVATVNNLAPVLVSHDSSASQSLKAMEGEPVTVFGAFTDVGTLDTHAVEVDWGDGAVTAAAVVQGSGSGSFSAEHAYAGGGIFTVTIALTDDDTGFATAVETVFITGAGVQTIDGKQVLFVVGTNGADQVHVNTQEGALTVHATFLPGGKRSFPQPIDEIRLFLCAGDDRGSIAANVNIPALLDGGAGDDHLNAGAAGAVLLAGDGNDVLVGGGRNDVLIGGHGADRLVGNKGEDVLIGGFTTFELGGQDGVLAAQAALLFILAEWNSARPLSVRQVNIAGTGVGPRLNDNHFLQHGVTVLDDGEADKLTGSAGTDWFFLFGEDEATDFHEASELLN